ncbi:MULTISPECIES: methyl-accepting chemotaxis protein [unclassified Leptolyngbya]|uniref:methyl-accepting chemotaxis protein n=1 Tax=unclassified Leptolyngbya TaxID=2650499 RepID=UPI001687D429|nr:MULTISPECIES: methyl-accepting chemotaxis protein [unclassified Leptolyngbya]MBD1911103.1 methyl-accepting chemotaxis protein [Leptolyngbya sp. FACHB-8]MBD2157085.1 methyl-accepting chemotaxis protein [Leptolyngbya sp. FACHB-16]
MVQSIWDRITNRILLGYSIPLLALLGLSAIVYDSTTRTFQLQQESDRIETQIRNVNGLIDGLNRMIGITRTYLIFPSDQSAIDAYSDARQSFTENAENAIATSDAQTQADISNLIELGEEYDRTLQTIFRLVDQNNLVQAKADVRRPRISDAVAQRDRVVGELENQLNRNNQAVQNSKNFLLRLIVIGTGLTILLTLAAGLLTTLPLRRQLPPIVDAATAIADGDLTQSIPPTKDPTEVGQLLRAFQEMVKSLNALIAQAQRSGIQISSSTTQIAAAGRQLESTVNEQVASMHEVKATSRQIASTAGELAQAMDEVTDTAQTTTSAAANSQENLDKIQGAMQNLVVATQSIAAKLKVIDEKANNINNVVTTITKVADQTNLLSLNAAIEAEKAGEYGAGFAVVAREIRRLADQAAVATLEIEQMVKAMQTSVSTGVVEMDRFSREVTQYVQEVGNVSEQITSFIQDVQGLAPQFATVSQRMDEQYRGAEQISMAIAQLSDASLQTMQSLQETNNALTQLDDAAQGLQQEISQFKV